MNLNGPDFAMAKLTAGLDCGPRKQSPPQSGTQKAEQLKHQAKYNYLLQSQEMNHKCHIRRMEVQTKALHTATRISYTCNNHWTKMNNTD